jgi:hypothetical protein
MQRLLNLTPLLYKISTDFTENARLLFTEAKQFINVSKYVLIPYIFFLFKISAVFKYS